MNKLMKYMKNKKVGSTPVVYHNNIYYKLEFFNPSGSIKDRAAFNILDNYYQLGLIKEGTTIVIPTSGNMGISLAYFGRKFKIKVIVVMPENVSIERITILKKYQAKIILTSSEKGMKGSIEEAEKISKEQGYLLIDQFNNIYNKLAHMKTGREILDDIPGIDYIVCGIGTAGTISGIGEELKNKRIKIIGVEPYESSVITNGKKGIHKIEGIGAGFIPPLFKVNNIYKVAKVKSREVMEKFKKDNPLLIGKSSIACEIVAHKILKKAPNAKILVIVADGVDRYESLIE